MSARRVLATLAAVAAGVLTALAGPTPAFADDANVRVEVLAPLHPSVTFVDVQFKVHNKTKNKVTVTAQLEGGKPGQQLLLWPQGTTAQDWAQSHVHITCGKDATLQLDYAVTGGPKGTVTTTITNVPACVSDNKGDGGSTPQPGSTELPHTGLFDANTPLEWAAHWGLVFLGLGILALVFSSRRFLGWVGRLRRRRVT